MPRITIERKVPVIGNMFKIEEEVYELPDRIIYKDLVLDWDSYRQEFSDRYYTMIVKGKDYVKEMLKAAEEKEGKE